MTTRPTKTRVYLSKSNAGSIVPINDVKRILSQMDIEIVEFLGGNYTTDKLKSSDILLVIPPALKHINHDGAYFDLGKGQCTEIQVFAETKEISDVLIVSGRTTDLNGKANLQVELITDIDDLTVIDINWQLYYAKLRTDNEPEFITIYDEFKFNESVPLKLDYDWQGAIDSLKPNTSQPVSIKGLNNGTSIFPTELLQVRLNGLHVKVLPMLACIKLRK